MNRLKDITLKWLKDKMWNSHYTISHCIEDGTVNFEFTSAVEPPRYIPGTHIAIDWYKNDKQEYICNVTFYEDFINKK